MKIKKLLKSILVLLVGILAISCGSKDDGKTLIRFATWDNADSLANQQKWVDEFNSSHDKIKVVIEAYGSNYDTKITAAMGSQDAPDVMYMWNYPKYQNGLLDLTDLIAKEGKEFEEDYYKTLWNYNSIEGKKLGLPVGYTTHVLYFNKDLFDKNNVEYPNENWTWNDVVNASRKITNSKEKVFGFAFPLKPDPYDYEMFAWSNGSSFVDSKGNPNNAVNSKETIEAFTVFQNMLKENIAVATDDYGEKSFLLGKVGMYMNGAWSLAKLNEKGINYGVALLPKFNNKDAKSIISSSGVAISKDSKHKEEAFEFIKYWTGKEMNEKRIGYEFPVLKSVVTKLQIDKDETNKYFYEMLELSKENMPASFITDKWSELSEKLSLALEKMFNKNSYESPSEALNEVTK